MNFYLKKDYATGLISLLYLSFLSIGNRASPSASLSCRTEFICRTEKRRNFGFVAFFGDWWCGGSSCCEEGGSLKTKSLASWWICWKMIVFCCVVVVVVFWDAYWCSMVLILDRHRRLVSCWPCWAWNTKSLYNDKYIYKPIDQPLTGYNITISLTL